MVFPTQQHAFGFFVNCLNCYINLQCKRHNSEEDVDKTKDAIIT